MIYDMIFSVARSGPRRSLKDGVHETSQLRIFIIACTSSTYLPSLFSYIPDVYHIYLMYTTLHRHAELSPASTQSHSLQ